MPTQRTCMECLEEFIFKGGSLCCSDECRLYHDIRMRESYNVYRKIERDVTNRRNSGQLDKEGAKKELTRHWNERDDWLKDKTMETEVQWRGNAPYPNEDQFLEEE